MAEKNSLFDIAQIYSGVHVKTDNRRDGLLTAEAKSMLEENCLFSNESYQDLFARISMNYADNSAHAQRLYDYMSQFWFMPSWEILSKNKMNISGFINESDDNLQSIIDTWNENSWFLSRGVKGSTYWGSLRSAGEVVGSSGAASGAIPFIKVQDDLNIAIAGDLKSCVYISVSHPEIESFLDTNYNNLTQGVAIGDSFMRAVENNEDWALTSPKNNEVIKTVKAIELWNKIIKAEVNILFVDNANRALPEHHKLAGLSIKAASVEGDIIRPTGIDKFGHFRSAVTCKSAVNLLKFEEWENHPMFIEDVMRFLDNVLSDFIKSAPDTMLKAKYSAMRERSVALGVMGFSSLLEKKNIDFSSVAAKVWNKRIFKHLQEKANAASANLAKEKGACPDALDYGVGERFSSKLAIFSTKDVSIIAGEISDGVLPSQEAVNLRDILEMAIERQKYICQSQNLKLCFFNEYSIDSIRDLYIDAWKNGIKSIS